MTDKPLQSLYCAWHNVQLWGLMRGEEIIHLSFDQEHHRALCGKEDLEAVSQAKQKEICALLLRILQGEPRAFPEESPSIRQGTPFQQKVWRLLSRIPFATTRTYGEIAAELGNPHLARAVGQACHRNPLAIIIPCHRVVSSTGLGGFAGGPKVKEALLDYEQDWLKAEVEK